MDRDDGNLLTLGHGIEVRVGKGRVIEETQQCVKRPYLRFVHVARLTEEVAQIFDALFFMALTVIRVNPGIDDDFAEELRRPHHAGRQTERTDLGRHLRKSILPLRHECPPLRDMRPNIVLYGVKQDFRSRTDIVHGIMGRTVRDMAVCTEVFELMIRQIRIEAPENIERIVIAAVRELRQTETREFAAEDAEVIRDIVADDNRVLGKSAKARSTSAGSSPSFCSTASSI